MEQGYSIRRVNKVNLLVIIGVALVMIMKTVLFEKSMEDVIYASGAIVIALALFFIPYNKWVKGFILGVIPSLIGVALNFLNGFNMTHHYLILLSLAMMALYLETKMLGIFMGLINVAVIGTYVATPELYLGDGSGLSNFLSVIIMFNGMMVLLMFLTKWGKDLINQSLKISREATQALENLSNTVNEVEMGTTVLSDSSMAMSNNALATLESSRQVATAMQEISVGVQEQAGSVSEINHQVDAISTDVGKAHDISALLTSLNSNMMTEVTSGEEQIANMKSQMQIIDDAIEAAIITVKDLEDSMGDIQNFLEVITTISSQTNLLALNASIESARAGEAGKGFAVVADEIRKLAEQSAESVQDINQIVESVGKKTKDAVSTVNQGNEAVDVGSVIIERITTQYATIKESFVKNNEELDKEIKMIDQINDAFLIVHERIANIASISEQQSASTEEILATIENQESNIENLTISLKDIEELSEKLSKLIEDVR